jgi:dTDP-4-amino-4,6-dideoxygalactose transaminase
MPAEDDGRLVHMKSGQRWRQSCGAPVAVAGDLEAVLKLAVIRLKVLEDACQAHGAMAGQRGWKRAAAGMRRGSLHPVRTRRWGAVMTDDEELAARMRGCAPRLEREIRAHQP